MNNLPESHGQSQPERRYPLEQIAIQCASVPLVLTSTTEWLNTEPDHLKDTVLWASTMVASGIVAVRSIIKLS